MGIKDLKRIELIYAKAVMFLLIILMAVYLNLFSDVYSIRVFSVVVLIWSSARLYYFLFYVIEHYIDSEFKYSGLWAALLYLVRRAGSN